MSSLTRVLPRCSKYKLKYSDDTENNAQDHIITVMTLKRGKIGKLAKWFTELITFCSLIDLFECESVMITMSNE